MEPSQYVQRLFDIGLGGSDLFENRRGDTFHLLDCRLNKGNSFLNAKV